MSDSRRIKRLAFLVNESKSGTKDLADQLRSLAEGVGCEVRYSADFPVKEGFLEGIDLCCVIGGDGTFLSAAVESATHQVPLLGVNRGTLGFLTTYAPDEIEELFPEVLMGSYQLKHRSLLECETYANQVDYALNDVVVKSAGIGRIVHINVYANDEFITRYVCDGLIFSSPTGSTAYTLSAGGPMVHPDAGVISLTPICAHTLSNRSIILPVDVELRVENAQPREELLVAVDGQRNLTTLGGCPIRIRTSERKLPIAQRVDYSHFSVVRHKLHWNGGYAGNAYE